MLDLTTFKFLTAVAKHNNREWFMLHKEAYEQAKSDVLTLIEQLIPELSRIDPLFSAETPAKRCLLRIYRDVRFSKNKDPYKSNFGIWFPTATKGESGPGYYIQIQPGHSFFGAGYWSPDPQHLKLIRQEIDYNGTDFHRVIDDKDFKKAFAFTSSDTLKKAPKGYDPLHEDIKYLKLRSFEVTRTLPDEAFFNPGIVEMLVSSFQMAYPFNAFLRNAIAD